MSKAEINNEIVLMRKKVRQGRVRVVKKLIKEAKKLREKRGVEQQQEKYKRKAERLIAEVLAIKKIRDDEITQFAITNTKPLKAILEDPEVVPLTRIMARITSQELFQNKILEFKSKYPNYAEYLGPGRKKLDKLKKKGKLPREIAVDKSQEKEIGTNEMDVDDSVRNDSDNDQSVDLNEESSDEAVDEYETDKEENEQQCHQESDNDSDERSESESEKEINIKTKLKCPKTTVDSVPKPLKISKTKQKVQIKKPKPIKTVSKVAVVKKFTELLQEDDTHEIEAEDISNSKICAANLQKEVDTFFTTGNGNQNYLSVAVPKIKPEGDEYDNEHGRRNFSERPFPNNRNSKFFNKVGKPDNSFRKNNDNFKRFGQNSGKRFDSDKKMPNVRQNSFKSVPQSNKSKFEVQKNSKNNVKTQPKDEILHPSWEAKRKQQDMLKQGFQGKKIVFDD